MRHVFQNSNNNGNRLMIVKGSLVNANIKNIVDIVSYRVFCLAVLNVWSLFDIKSAKVSKTVSKDWKT